MGRHIAQLLHPGFILTGVVSNLLGALLPVFTARWGLSDALAGDLFAAQYLGILTGNTAFRRTLARAGLVRSLALGYFIMAGGVLGLGADGWLVAECSIFAYGLALGLTIPSTNLLVAEVNPGRSAAALNLLNVAWCIGAVICSPLCILFAERHALLLPQLLLAASVSAVGLYLLKTARGSSDPPELSGRLSGSTESIWREPMGVAIGALIFFYVGAETAVGGWVSTYTKRAIAASPTSWALAQSEFWATLLVGRAMAPYLLRRVCGERLVLGGLCLALTGTCLLLTSHGPVALWSGIGLTGSGMALVFPTTIAIYSQFFGARASRSVGLIFACGGLGGASIPWMVGLASSRAGSLRTGLIVVLLAVVTMIVIQARIVGLLRRSRGFIAANETD